VDTGRQVTASIETRASWVVATAALIILSIAYGSLYIVVVGLKPMAAEFGDQRAIVSLAYSLGWFGGAVGGIAITPLADRIGVKWTVIGGAIMVALGLYLSAQGETWQLHVGHGLFIGVLGNAGINAPLLVHVSRWFDRHRGAALAMISSGQHIAGAFWPVLFERAIAGYGWRQTMIAFGLLEVALVVPLALIFLRSRPPEVEPVTAKRGTGAHGTDRVVGLRPNVAFALLAVASFFCCIPMSMPAAHLIAYCGDLGLTAKTGAAMLSVLLVSAVISRQFWGWLSDRIGGLNTLLICSVAQAAAMAAFSVTQDEAGLFFVASAFGLGFSGLIPAYIFTVRELFPAKEASWRVPVQLLCAGSGMAMGGWLAGYIYDQMGFYAPAFATGIAFNLANTAILAFLVLRQTGERRKLVQEATAAAE
jgi:MFS family permease